MEIKCKKISCEHNKNTICMSKEITINSFQGCDSYSKRKTKIKLPRKINRFETSYDIVGNIHCPDSKINCNCLDCKFNYDNLCASNGITITAGDDTGICLSHLDK